MIVLATATKSNLALSAKMHGETVRFRQHSIFRDEVKNLRVFGENTALSYAFSLKTRNKTVRFRRQRNYANLREFEMF
jgi:hypothetical protein